MNRWTITAAIIFTLVLPIARPALSKTAAPPPEIGVVNRGVVELETARGAGISVRIAEDLANVIDDGATRRVLPVIGKGALQNVTDLKLLRGIDMAILQTDVLDYARQQNLFPGIESWATYFTMRSSIFSRGKTSNRLRTWQIKRSTSTFAVPERRLRRRGSSNF